LIFVVAVSCCAVLSSVQPFLLQDLNPQGGGQTPGPAQDRGIILTLCHILHFASHWLVLDLSIKNSYLSNPKPCKNKKGTELNGSWGKHSISMYIGNAKRTQPLQISNCCLYAICRNRSCRRDCTPCARYLVCWNVNEVVMGVYRLMPCTQCVLVACWHTIIIVVVMSVSNSVYGLINGCKCVGFGANNMSSVWLWCVYTCTMLQFVCVNLSIYIMALYVEVELSYGIASDV
jgi:hypothetical protein